VKKIQLIIIFLFSSLHLSAQIDISTNLFDILQTGGSFFCEKGITKSNSLELGIIHRNVRKSIYESVGNHSNILYYNAQTIFTRLDFKIYFSKNRSDLKGFYTSIFNRNEITYKWESGYKDKYNEVYGDNPYALSNFQSVEIGLSVGYKKVFINNLYIYTSVGYSFELLEHFGYSIYQRNGFKFNPIGHFGIGYRFNKSEKSSNIQ